jgi:hypothetical protein
MEQAGRMVHRDWDLYDTRHVVYRPASLTADQLETGYWRAYREFYTWGSIARGAWTKDTLLGAARHAAYAGGWKKFEPLWDLIIRAKQASHMLPVLEAILSGFGRFQPERAPKEEGQGVLSAITHEYQESK